MKAITRGRYDDSSPSWSPNGRRLAFERIDPPSGLATIITVGRDGRRLRRLLPWQRPLVGGPLWSPDGRWVAFSTFGGVYEVRASGGSVLQILASSRFGDPGRYSIRVTPEDWQAAKR